MHRSTSLLPQDVHREGDGLPVTTVARTLLDLATTLTATRLERACHRAEIAQCLDVTAIEAAIARATRPGAHRLFDAIDRLAATGAEVTRSEMEVRFPPHRPVRASEASHERHPGRPRGRLPLARPPTGRRDRRRRRAPHGKAFAHDRRRDAVLQVAGLRVVRFTWRELTQRPRTVERTLRALLLSPG